jgi:murein DD-endopeptidase MepM/ murein hydrolase activator NlpD
MRAKFFIGVFFIFIILVIGNYLFTLAGSMLSFHPAARADELSVIDFSFFKKGGVGRSYITQGYGITPYSSIYKGDWHNGIDIAAAYGAPIYSPGEGTVLATGNQDDYCYGRGFGRYVAVDDGANHLVLWYAHLGKISVSPGDHIKKGDQIGTVGASGFETGTHLHFSIFAESGFSMQSRNGCGPDATGKDLDPLSYLGTVYN